MASAKPIGLRIRMYQVGFGDCFLLSFEYGQALDDGRKERHVLIDFGSTSMGGRLSSLNQIAKLIRDHAQGKIDVIVVTHRHRDHLSAFGDKQIAKLLVDPGYPKLVIRSWTEDPDLDRGARGPAAAGTGIAPSATRGNARDTEVAIGPKSRRFMRTLGSAETFTTGLFEKIRKSPPNSLAAEASGLAEDQLKNEDAVNQLKAWGDAGKPAYLHYGMRSGIESVVPGIRTRVLGPPTVDQHEAVKSQRESDPDEFWMIYNQLLGNLTRTDLIGPAHGKRGLPASTESAAHAGAHDDVSGVAPDPAETDAPDSAGAFGPVGPVRWLTDRMGRQQLNSLYRIVRILDGVLNNTSVILLFDVDASGKRIRLLFGGDAQIENWEYALKRTRNRALLREVDVYKVGHHGSRNATPRTLFNLWKPRSKSDPRWALLSTKPGVHGKSPATAVPRETLVAALDTSMTLRSTNLLADRVPYVELHADLRAGKAFQEVSVPPIPTRARKRSSEP
ncbi:MAG: hypothetical protein H0W81_02115 [Chloroflexi bacterium]|nr:hypothetical protein [Chloroflexota bacterium]